MDTDEQATASALPIYQQLLEEVDPGTRETVIAMVGTQQDSHRPGGKQERADSKGEGRLTTRR